MQIGDRVRVVKNITGVFLPIVGTEGQVTNIDDKEMVVIFNNGAVVNYSHKSKSYSDLGLEKIAGP